jgi:hypothetical protein
MMKPQTQRTVVIIIVVVVGIAMVLASVTTPG